MSGDWWTVYGQSCGQVDQHGDWGGAHDWVPCSHARFRQLESGDWINNTTFCVGSDSVCTVGNTVTRSSLLIYHLPTSLPWAVSGECFWFAVNNQYLTPQSVTRGRSL